ncbi:MAG: hypothetical protein HFH80_08255 [Lachnospiraceae bacterium]|nr:hypothetical protein [Lachnospiraceae bacterium]
MNQMKRKRLYYRSAAILLSCFSGTFLLMPLAGRFSQENARAVLACVGTLFWITGIGGYTLLLLAHRAERRMGGKDEGTKRTEIFPGKTLALILDLVFTVGVVILILWSGKLSMQRYGAYVVLFVTTMAFHMRLLLGARPDRGRKCSRGGMKNDRGGKKGAR